MKGRAGVGMASLSWSEFAKAIELGDDYWLYLVLDCATPSPAVPGAGTQRRRWLTIGSLTLMFNTRWHLRPSSQHRRDDEATHRR